jgi:hypothetical protein
MLGRKEASGRVWRIFFEHLNHKGGEKRSAKYDDTQPMIFINPHLLSPRLWADFFLLKLVTRGNAVSSKIRTCIYTHGNGPSHPKYFIFT